MCACACVSCVCSIGHHVISSNSSNSTSGNLQSAIRKWRNAAAPPLQLDDVDIKLDESQQLQKQELMEDSLSSPASSDGGGSLLDAFSPCMRRALQEPRPITEYRRGTRVVPLAVGLTEMSLPANLSAASSANTSPATESSCPFSPPLPASISAAVSAAVSPKVSAPSSPVHVVVEEAEATAQIHRMNSFRRSSDPNRRSSGCLHVRTTTIVSVANANITPPRHRRVALVLYSCSALFFFFFLLRSLFLFFLHTAPFQHQRSKF